MTIRQAREAAQQWMKEAATQISGFCAAYTAGSTNWLPEDAELSPASDLDIMVVITDPGLAGQRQKLAYRNALLEISYLANEQFQSPEQILIDYHLCPSFRTAKILLDPMGHLTPLLAAVAREYPRRAWVRQRCRNARNKVLQHLQSIRPEAALHDQVTGCLFAAGVTAHILLVAGLKNPTVRTRYTAARKLLAGYNRGEFHETLLELLGSARISQERVRHHLANLTAAFDTAARAIKSSFPFSSDISEIARPIAIDGSREMIECGFPREAMFWIAVTHSRCRKVLARDAPDELAQRFEKNYQELLGDLSLSGFTEIRERCAQIELALPRVCEVAENIIAANREIEDD